MRGIPCISILDKDEFEPPNEFTQILLGEDSRWNGQPKASYLAPKLEAWGFKVSPEQRELAWGELVPKDHSNLAMLGLDDFEPRRIAIESGYEWIVDAGIGTSFVKPRVSWHSLPPNRKLASQLFSPASTDRVEAPETKKAFFQELRRTPGECGWFNFRNVRASAPSMGLVASAYAWSEMLSVMNGARTPAAGAAYIWSPLMPTIRELLRIRP
jgi:hypothetical protein